MVTTVKKPKSPTTRLAEVAYVRIKEELFGFALVPGERFSENELSARLGMSRTPVREALYRLGQEGYIVVSPKSGWTVRPFDFHYFEELYELRAIVEVAAVAKLCASDPMPDLQQLREEWLVAPEERLADGVRVSVLDESFHASLVRAAGNAELARVHGDITDRIRAIRRLDFMYPERIRATYTEHAQILRAVLRRKPDQAAMLLRAHIEESKSEVKKISLHKLYEARSSRHA